MLFPLLLAAAASNPQVLIVYDRKTPDSISIASYYARARHIPEANLCGVSLTNPAATGLSFTEYVRQIRTPVQQCLDKVGKTKILYIVLAYVRTFSIEIPSRFDRYALDSYLADIWDVYATKAFDPLPSGPHPYYVPNHAKDNVYQPFLPFADLRARKGAPLLYAVWRLDGATPAIARSLVDNALSAEAALGPKGQICIDEQTDPRGHEDLGYFAADWDLLRAAEFLSAAGYKVLVDNKPTEFGTAPSPMCPNTAAYAGWYKVDHYNDAFKWNTGAIGIHLDSLSARDPRSGTNWVANALQHGITVTAGAVAEPYLVGLPRPDGLFRDLLAGSNVGDAFLRNTRYLKWMILNIGDPLYVPLLYHR